VSGLTNGTAYTFTVAAWNDAGFSTASSPSSAVTPRTVPGAPTGVSAVPGNGQATVSWTAPVDNGGAAIVKYVVTASPGGASAQAGPGDSSVVVPGLVNGTAYTFTVVASNATGDSLGSAPSAAVTPSGGRPDGAIKSASGSFVGAGVYNATGAGQTVQAKAKPGSAATFTLQWTNNGQRDRLRIIGARSTSGFAVTYLLGSINVTAQVLSGGYLTDLVEPGQTLSLTAKVKVKKSSKPGKVENLLVSAAGASPPTSSDAVLAKVKVKGRS
jgi:hypothetical protein